MTFKLVPAGEDVVLKAAFAGQPAPSVEWLRNGEAIATNNNSRIKIVIAGDETSLTIAKIQHGDEGEYSCRLRNMRGIEVCKCQVELEKVFKPTPIEEVVPPVKKKPAEKKPPRQPVSAPAKKIEPIIEEKPAAPAEAPVEEPKPVEEEKPAVVEAPQVQPEPEPAPAPVPEPVAPVVEEKPAPAPVPEPVKKPEPKKVEVKKPEPAKKAPEPAKKPAAVPEKKTEVKKTEAAKVTSPPPAAAKVASPPPAVAKVASPPPAAAKVASPPPPEPVKVASPPPEPVKVASPEPVPVQEEAPAAAEVVEKKPDEEEAKTKKDEVKLSFSRHLKSQNLVESEALILECDVIGKEPLELVWLRNGKEIPENPDFIREKKGNLYTLTVTEIFPEDSGVFSAELFNESTNQTLISSCSVVVKGKDEPELDPRFLLFPTSANVDEGSPARVECHVDGTQPISGKISKPLSLVFYLFIFVYSLVKWFKNNTQIEESDRVKFESDEESGKYALVIPTCLSIDDGQYHASASNSNGEVIAAFSLIVSFENASDQIDVKKILETN